MLGTDPENEALVNPDPVYSNTNKEPVTEPPCFPIHNDWEYLISELATLFEAVGIPAVLNLNWTHKGTLSPL